MDLLSLPQLQHLNISRLIGRIPPRLPSSLRTLEMAQCHITYLAHNGGSVGFSHVSLPQLTHLSLAQWPSLSLEQLRAFLEPSRGELIHLDISGCYDIMYEHLEDLITLGLFKKIEILKLKACMINDEVAILLARNGPRLKVIDLACTKVSGVGVKALVTGLQGKLERLCLDECRSTSIDAVEFARSRGVKVAFGFPDSIGGGKRVRQS